MSCSVQPCRSPSCPCLGLPHAGLGSQHVAFRGCGCGRSQVGHPLASASAFPLTSAFPGFAPVCLLGSMLVGEEPNPVRPRADLRTSSDTVAAVGTLYLGITFLRWVAAFPPLEYKPAFQSSKGRQALGLSFLLLHQGGPEVLLGVCFPSSSPCLCLPVFFASLWVPESPRGQASVRYKAGSTPVLIFRSSWSRGVPSTAPSKVPAFRRVMSQQCCVLGEVRCTGWRPKDPDSPVGFNHSTSV